MTAQFNIRRLSDLVNGHRLDTDKVNLILSLRKEDTKPVQPEALDIIGEVHFMRFFIALSGGWHVSKVSTDQNAQKPVLHRKNYPAAVVGDLIKGNGSEDG